MPSPFVIEVLDSTFRRVGFVGAPLGLTLTPRWNAVTTADLVVSNRDPAVGILYAAGARLRITFKGETYTGAIRAVSGTASADSGTLTFSMQSDLAMLAGILAWPKPTASLDGQSVEFDVRTGSAETIAKGFIAANASRLGLPVTVAPDQGRGAVPGTIGAARVQGRMENLSDLLLPVLESAGLGLNITQVGAGFTVDVSEPVDYPRVLTETSGVIASWEMSRAAPTATRIVLGGGGEKTAKTFSQVIGTQVEADWGTVSEVYRDGEDVASDYTSAVDDAARAKEELAAAVKDVATAEQNVKIAQLAANAAPTDTVKASELTDAVAARTAAKTAQDKAQATYNTALTKQTQQRALFLTELGKAGGDELSTGAATVGLRITLSETATFTYGGPNGLRVGTRLAMEVGPGVVVRDLLRECVISWTADEGLQVTPVVGEMTSSTNRTLSKVLGGLAASLRKLISRK